MKSRAEAIGMPFPRMALLYPMTAETTVDIEEYSKLQVIVSELRNENQDLNNQLQGALHVNKELENKARDATMLLEKTKEDLADRAQYCEKVSRAKEASMSALKRANEELARTDRKVEQWKETLKRWKDEKAKLEAENEELKEKLKARNDELLQAHEK